jgi:hypothetical protein
MNPPAAHPYWLWFEDLQLRGQVRRIWRADVPNGEWVATPHEGNPNMHDCVEVRAPDRDALLVALRKAEAIVARPSTPTEAG